MIAPLGYLASSKNRLAAGPNELLRAENVVNVDGAVEPRRGQDYLYSPTAVAFQSFYGGVSANCGNMKPIKIFFYNDRIWGYFRDSVAQTDGLAYFDPNTKLWTWDVHQYKLNYSDATHGPQLIEADRRLLFSSAYGVMCSPKIENTEFSGANVDVYQTKLKKAGCPQAITFQNAVLTDTTGGLANNVINPGCRVAYRHLWKKVNANGTVAIGPPSPRLSLTNTNAAARTFTLTIRIPDEIVLDEPGKWTCQIYRTRTSKPDTSGTAAPEPGDDMYLVAEIKPTVSELALATPVMNFVDIQSDATLQDPLYTNELQYGAAAARYRPPLCKTMEYWQNCAWFGNIKDQWTVDISIQGVEDTGAAVKSGLRINDIVAIGGRSFKAVAAAAQPWEFTIDTTTGIGSQITRCLNSAVNLTRKFNENYDNNRYFVMQSYGNPDDFVGKAYLIEREQGVLEAIDPTYKPYLGLYRANGWASAADACPIAPTPLVTASKGKGQYVTAIDCAGAGQPIKITVNAAPDFVIGDIIDWAPAAALGLVQAAVPVGQYKVTFFDSATQFRVTRVSTGSALTGSGAIAYAAGGGSFASTTFLGIVFCVFDSVTELTSQAIGVRDVRPNRVYRSEPLEPESAPILNYLEFGNTDKGIIRLKRLGESLFVFKEDGLFRAQGYVPTFYNSSFDPNVIIMSPESVCEVGGELVALTTTGVYRINEESTELISGPIKHELEYIFNQNPSGCRRYSFAVSQNNDGRALIWVPSSGTIPDTCFVWDGTGWTRRNDQATSAAYGVASDIASDKHSLYTAKNRGCWLTKERRTGTITDYCDELINVPIGKVIVRGPNQISVDLSNIQNEYTPILISENIDFTGAVVTVEEGLPGRAVVTSSTTAGGVYILNLEFPSGASASDWGSYSSVSIYMPYSKSVQFNIGQDSPSKRKHFSDYGLFFRQPYFTTGDLTYSTDINPVYQSYTGELSGFAGGLWDSAQSWPIKRDDPALEEKVIKRNIPKTHSQATFIRVGFTLPRAMEYFSLYGFDIRGNIGGAMIERNNNA